MSDTNTAGKPLPKLITKRVEEVHDALFPVQAPAKINLRLRVIGRRTDGYHLLEMINCSVNIADEIGIRFWSTSERGSEISLVCEGDDGAAGSACDNIAQRAVREFWSSFGFDAPPLATDIHITKRIPIGAGLGGGSSDAAAVLRLHSALFGPLVMEALSLTMAQFQSLILAAALRCGADVPYSYIGGVCVVRGIGEDVLPVPRSSIWPGEVLVVVPHAAINTGRFFKWFREQYRDAPFSPAEPDLLTRITECADGRTILCNDFERSICEFEPKVSDALSVLRRHVPCGAGITGSGAALFALMDENDPRIAPLEQELLSIDAKVFRTRLLF